MKKSLFAFLALLAFVACTGKPKEAAQNCAEGVEVAFEVGKNYFFKNGSAVLPINPKIISEAEFNKLFGMATTMGEGGRPTPIDFTEQFVLAIVLPVTDVETEIHPLKVVARGDSLFYSYEVRTGEKQSFSIQPVSIIILDKQYENKEVVLINAQETACLLAIDRYLIQEIGCRYAKGEHCVPIHSIVGVDNRNAEDILVWGDFWVFNYNQVGDTLKCVSGGSHPGLMHVRQTEKGFEVMGFDQVEDGSNYLPTAQKIFGERYEAFHAVNSDEQKREVLRAEVLADYVKAHSLAVTMYQDFGWPAKKL